MGGKVRRRGREAGRYMWEGTGLSRRRAGGGNQVSGSDLVLWRGRRPLERGCKLWVVCMRRRVRAMSCRGSYCSCCQQPRSHRRIGGMVGGHRGLVRRRVMSGLASAGRRGLGHPRRRLLDLANGVHRGLERPHMLLLGLETGVHRGQLKQRRREMPGRVSAGRKGPEQQPMQQSGLEIDERTGQSD